MFITEPFVHARGGEVFDKSGMMRDLIPWTNWQRMIELQKAEDINCFVISHERYADEFFHSLKKGSLLIRYGVGYDSVPLNLCSELGILLAHTPGTLHQSVAEHVVALMISIARHIPEMNRTVKNGNWQNIMGDELNDRAIAIAGFGTIGRTLAKILKFGFGMKVIAFDTYAEIENLYPDLFDEFTSDFNKAVADADYVSIHMSLNPSTRGFINKQRLDNFKPGAVLINTARGGVVEESDLYDSLTSGPIAYAGLDVFQHEPYIPEPGKDLRTLENVVFTPHVASHTIQSNQRMAVSCINSVKSYLAGRLQEIPVVPELKHLI